MINKVIAIDMSSTHSVNSAYKQYIIIRKDLVWPVSVLAAQVSHASMASTYPLMMYDDPSKVDTSIFHRLNITSISAYNRNRNNTLGWLGSIFTKVLVQVNSLDKMYQIMQCLRKDEIAHTLMRESGPVRIGKLIEVVRGPQGDEMYLLKNYPYSSPYTNMNSYVQKGFIYFKPTDPLGLVTTLGVAPVALGTIPGYLQHLPLYN